MVLVRGGRQAYLWVGDAKPAWLHLGAYHAACVGKGDPARDSSAATEGVPMTTKRDPLDLAAIEARCAHVPREYPLMGFGDVLFALLQATASDALHLVAEVRALAESDAEHVAMMQAEHDRRVEAEAEVRRLQGALRNLKRNF